MLERPVRDLDLSVDGDALSVGRRVAAALENARIEVYERFGTATVATPGGERLDFAATRTETYDRPGALPRVFPAPIEQDLLRRDFTIHAMAVELTGRLPGPLLDPSGGREDLAKRSLCILHPLSFRDDPTRAYRAARYANRLGFRVEPGTRRQVRGAVRGGFFDAVSGDRIRRELRLLLSENDRAGCVAWVGRLGLAPTLHRALPTGARPLARLRAAERRAGHSCGPVGWVLYLLVWAADLAVTQAGELAARLSMAGSDGERLARWPETLGRLSGMRSPRPSRIASLELSVEEILAAAVVAERPGLRAALSRALGNVSLALTISGSDLLRAGVAPGPRVGRALSSTLAARQDGMISAGRELEFALRDAWKESS